MLKPIFLGLALAFVMLTQSARVEAIPTISAGAAIPQPTPGVFVVPIEITDAVDLINWQFYLAFDPAVVQINVGCDNSGSDPFCDLFNGPVTEGPFTKGLFSLFVPGVIDNTSGLLSIVAGAWGDPPPGPSGDGILAYVEFITIHETGNPDIRVTDSSVLSSAIPEPATLLLMGSGFMMIGVGRLSRRLRSIKS
jgi:hypothetical protein